MIRDQAYDGDPVDERLATQGITLIAPPWTKRKRPKTQDGRPLCRGKQRRKIKHRIAWLQDVRRVVVCYEDYAENYLGFVQLGGLVILLRLYL